MPNCCCGPKKRASAYLRRAISPVRFSSAAQKTAARPCLQTVCGGRAKLAPLELHFSPLLRAQRASQTVPRRCDARPKQMKHCLCSPKVLPHKETCQSLSVGRPTCNFHTLAPIAAKITTGPPLSPHRHWLASTSASLWASQAPFLLFLYGQASGGHSLALIF